MPCIRVREGVRIRIRVRRRVLMLESRLELDSTARASLPIVELQGSTSPAYEGGSHRVTCCKPGTLLLDQGWG